MPDLDPAEWRKDLEALVAGIEAHHRDAWNFTSEAEVRRLAEDAKGRADEAPDFEMTVALQRIAAAIGDGHTFAAVSDFYAEYPLQLRWVENGFFVVGATTEHKDLLGGRLVAIDGMPIDIAINKIGTLIPKNENRWYELHRAAQLLTQAQVLTAQGITRSSRHAAFAFQTASGQLRKVQLTPRSSANRAGFLGIGPSSNITGLTPRNGLRAVMFGDVAYLDFASYENLAKDAPAIWSMVDEAQARALIIDFRANGGGSLPQGRQHIIYPAWERSKLNREGCLYVLIGQATFSAAMTNVTDMRRETEAILVGQPTGARPNGYQENRWFTLPHSGIEVSAAQRRYRFGSAGDKAVMPDLEVEQTIDDLRAGRDTVFSAALAETTNCNSMAGPR